MNLNTLDVSAAVVYPKSLEAIILRSNISKMDIEHF